MQQTTPTATATATARPSTPPALTPVGKLPTGQKISKALNNHKVKNVVAALFAVMVLATAGLAALALINKSARSYISAGMPISVNIAVSTLASVVSEAASAVSTAVSKLLPKKTPVDAKLD